MKKAGDFLAALFDANFMEKASGYSKLFSSWPAIAKEVKMPSLADHSWIRELEKSVLLVEADHPGWIQLLQTKQSDLLRVLRRRFPGEGFTGISFRLSREGPRPAPDVEPAKPAPDKTVRPPETARPSPKCAAGGTSAPEPERPPETPAKITRPPETARPSPARRLDSIKDARLRNSLAALEKALKGG
jgi:hypothetical protein